ncbi:MAG: BamA/TamA family outer membrane protein [Chitinophagaceae bacterium]
MTVIKNRNTYRNWTVTLLAIVIASCGVNKYLPPGEKLYDGVDVKVERDSLVKESAKSFRSQLEDLSYPKRNKRLFGAPYKVWWWYAIGPSKKEKGLRNWFRDKLGEPPVLSSQVSVSDNAANMQSFLDNNGYFRSIVTGDTTSTAHRFRAVYEAQVNNPYYLKEVTMVNDSTPVSVSISKLRGRPRLKVGDRYQLDNIKAERDRIDQALKRRGYYFFNSDYMVGVVDTTVGNYQTDLFLQVKRNIPSEARHPQTIHQVAIFPQYSLLSTRNDTSLRKAILYDTLLIRDSAQNFKPQLFKRLVTFRPGRLYDIRQHNNTQNRFISAGVFRFVKNQYRSTPVNDSTPPHQLDVYYYLTPMQKKNINFEVGAFTKSNSFTGGQLNVNWRNRNALKGAEQLMIKTYGAFEFSISDSLKNNNNWRLGTEVSFTFPRFITPIHIHENNLFPPRTRFLVGYEWLRRQGLYTKSSFKLQYDLNWKASATMEHTFSPISITYTRAYNFSDTYQKQIDTNPAIAYSTLTEIIPASYYNFTYSTVRPNAPNLFYFSGNAEVAGNIAGLVNKPDGYFSKKILNAYFAQYAKVDVDFRYTRRLSATSALASRIFIGVGAPYGNSPYLPFSRQYIIGGTNSLRGFRPRALGPGTVAPNAYYQIYYPQVGGDYKLEFNAEYRFPIAGSLKGALFFDGGNIWTKDTLLYGPQGKFSKDFLHQLAFDAGLGVRYDLSFIIIRLDFGFPLRIPSNPDGTQWVADKINPFKRSWRSDYMVVNFGIGYPF